MDGNPPGAQDRPCSAFQTGIGYGDRPEKWGISFAFFPEEKLLYLW